MLATCVAIFFLGGLAASARAATVTSSADSGPGSLRATIAAVEGGGSLIVSDCAFTGNSAGGNGGSATGSGEGRGGALYAQHSVASLTVSGSSFSANTAGGDGGSGEYSGRGRGGAIEYRGSGPLIFSGSTFSGNSAGGAGGGAINSGLGRGGAIFIAELATSTSVVDSVFTANEAGGDGGGGTFSGRGEGGAIEAEAGTGPLTADASTFTGNSAGGLAGVAAAAAPESGCARQLQRADGQRQHLRRQRRRRAGRGKRRRLRLRRRDPLRQQRQLSDRLGEHPCRQRPGGDGGVGNGGAISAAGLSPPSARLTNSTLVGNTAGGGGAIGRGGHDRVGQYRRHELRRARELVPIKPGGTHRRRFELRVRLPSADPQLESLADNGGPTETQALPPSSPAISAVPAPACPISVDQRGEPRPDYGKAFCDVGAYELQGPILAPAFASAATATFQVAEEGAFTVATTGEPTPSLAHRAAAQRVSFSDNGNGTATISGRPAAGGEGSYPITIEAANGIAPDATQSFMLIVAGPTPPPPTPSLRQRPAQRSSSRSRLRQSRCASCFGAEN